MTNSPRNANTEKKLLKLKRDNISTPKFWILVQEGKVNLCAQKIGENATEKITISKAAFNKFIDWYNADQK